MRYPLLVIALVAVWKSAHCQPCQICQLQSQDKPCVPNEPLTLPDKIVISPNICNDIEVKNKDFEEMLCKNYTNGFNLECTDPKYGNTYSCRLSCGPSVEEIGKGLNLDLLQNVGGFLPNSDNSNTNNNNNNGGGPPNLFDFNVFQNNDPSSKFGDFGDINNLFGNLNPRTKSGSPSNRRAQPPAFSQGAAGAGFNPPSGATGSPINPGPIPSGQYTPESGPASLSNANSDAVSIPDSPQTQPAGPNPALPPVASVDPPPGPQSPTRSVAASAPQYPEEVQTFGDSGGAQKSGEPASGGAAVSNSPQDFFGSGNVLGIGVGTGSGASTKKPRLSRLRNPFDDPGSPFSKLGQGNTRPFSQAFPDSAGQSRGSNPTDVSNPFGSSFGDGFFNYPNNNRRNGVYDPSGAAQPSLNNRGSPRIPSPSSPGGSNFLDEKTPNAPIQSFSAPKYDEDRKPGFNNPGSQGNPFSNSNRTKSAGS